jgi:hypothetical protein
MLMPAMARTFHVKVRGYDDEVFYDNPFDTTTRRFVDRDLTRIGRNPGKPLGHGYFCAVQVAERFAGRHLEFNVDKKRPATPSP